MEPTMRETHYNTPIHEGLYGKHLLGNLQSTVVPYPAVPRTLNRCHYEHFQVTHTIAASSDHAMMLLMNPTLRARIGIP